MTAVAHTNKACPRCGERTFAGVKEGCQSGNCGYGRKASWSSQLTKVFGYLRVSTLRQAESGLGIEAQKTAIQEWADTKKLDVQWVYEEAVSGTVPPEERPALGSCLQQLEDPVCPAGALVASRLDRVGRNTADVLTLSKRAQKNGWALVLLDLDIDSSTPAGFLRG